MNPWRRDLARLLAIFHSPKRTFAEIGETPNAAVVVVGILLVGSATRLITTELPDSASRQAQLLLALLVAVGWPFVVSALYLFVFDLFGAECSYRVILSVTLHAIWAVFAFATVSALLWRLVSGEPPLEVGEFLMSSTGVDERLARDLARMLNPLEIGRLLLTGLGFAIALRVASWMSFAVVFAGWFGFHSLPLLRFLLF